MVDVDAGAQVRPPACGSSVIEVDVGDEDVPDIAGGEVVFSKALEEGRQG